jgi:O-antigen ligase
MGGRQRVFENNPPFKKDGIDMVSAIQKDNERMGSVWAHPFASVWMIFMVLAVLAPVLPGFDIKNSVLQIGFSVLLVLYSFRFLKGRYRGGIIDALLLLFILYAALACSWSSTPWAALQHFFCFLPAWGVFLLLRQTPVENNEKYLWFALTLGFALASILGVLQLFSFKWIPACSATDRVFATFGSSEAWLISLFVIFPFLMGSTQWDFLRIHPVFRYSLGLLFLLNVLFAGVDSVGLGFGMAGLLLLGVSFRYDFNEAKVRKLSIIFGLLLLALGAFVVAKNASSVNDRVSVWKSSFQMFWDAPLLGWGGGSYNQQGYSYLSTNLSPRISVQPDFASHVHNEALELVVEYGLLGLGLWIAFLMAFTRQIFITSKSKNLLVRLGFSTLLGAAFASLFSDGFRQPGSVLILLTAMALWSNDVKPQMEKKASKPIARIAGVVLLLISIGLFWNAAHSIYLDQWAYPAAHLEERLPRDTGKKISVLKSLWSMHRGQPLEERILYALGEAYQKADRLKDAESVLKIAHQINPNSVKIWMLLGDVYYQDSRGDRELEESSNQAYGWALELEPESLEILTACAKLNCARQNYKTCSVLLQHIHRLQPENQWVRAQMKLIGL